MERENSAIHKRLIISRGACDWRRLSLHAGGL